MSVTIEVFPPSMPLSNVPVGEAFRRMSDGMFFFKTNEASKRNEGGLMIDTFVCVDAYTFEVHRIRFDARVQFIPRTMIRFYFGQQQEGK